jgi:hypothetical protein
MGFDQEEASGGAGRTDEASAYPERLGDNCGGNRSFRSSLAAQRRPIRPTTALDRVKPPMRGCCLLDEREGGPAAHADAERVLRAE